MEPTYSLQSHIFSDLQHNSYRDINIYNPLQIQHPPNGTSSEAEDFENYLDAEALSLNGDGNPESINLIVPQDCGGFNLGSFFVRRSLWSDRMLDMWWDPVFYEQRHMQWEHKEQDALEYLYQSQPWIRSHVAFLPQRMINAFPNGACGDDRGIPADGCPNTLTSSLQSNNNNKKKPLEPDVGECGVQGIHYQQKERDFLVNMAGCEWGRDCWQEMYSFRQLSHRMNRSVWIQFKDWIWETWHWKEMRERKRVEVEKAEKQRREKVAKEQAEKVRVAQQEAQRQAEVEAQAQAEAEAEAEANARLTPEQQLRAEAHAEEVKRAQAQLDKESAAEREAQLEAQARLNAEKRAKVEAAA
jgi:mannan polymerase II complex MNN10 subunit